MVLGFLKRTPGNKLLLSKADRSPVFNSLSRPGISYARALCLRSREFVFSFIEVISTACIVRNTCDISERHRPTVAIGGLCPLVSALMGSPSAQNKPHAMQSNVYKRVVCDRCKRWTAYGLYHLDPICICRYETLCKSRMAQITPEKPFAHA